MAANSKSKLKLLYLYRMLLEETDAGHGLSMRDIILRLNELEINAERKSLYRDIELLREFGVDIKTYQRNPVEYAIDHRDFSLSELMLMVDAVGSCKFLTQKQAKTLIGNIKSLASVHQQDLLDRRIHVKDRVKSQKKSIFNELDLIYNALSTKKKISFRYMRYDANGKRHATHNGEMRIVTPVDVSYDGGFYYLTVWSEEHEGLREYRVDRMDSLFITEEPATKNSIISNFNYTDDGYECFGRFAGGKETVILATRDEKVEIIMDRFGSRAKITSKNKEVYASVKVQISPQFFGWIAGLEGEVKIESPTHVVQEYKAFLNRLLEGC